MMAHREGNAIGCSSSASHPASWLLYTNASRRAPQDTSWNGMKQFLGSRVGNASVREMIMNYDAHAITDKMRRKVEELIAAKPSSFDRDAIYRVSQAAGPMAVWVKANISYSKVWH